MAASVPSGRRRPAISYTVLLILLLPFLQVPPPLSGSLLGSETSPSKPPTAGLAPLGLVVLVAWPSRGGLGPVFGHIDLGNPYTAKDQTTVQVTTNAAGAKTTVTTTSPTKPDLLEQVLAWAASFCSASVSSSVARSWLPPSRSGRSSASFSSRRLDRVPRPRRDRSFIIAAIEALRAEVTQQQSLIEDITTSLGFISQALPGGRKRHLTDVLDVPDAPVSLTLMAWWSQAVLAGIGGRMVPLHPRAAISTEGDACRRPSSRHGRSA